eukprot:ANDGO_03483.mRNA.1 Poly(ADP-ribose) glycohydrolase
MRDLIQFPPVDLIRSLYGPFLSGDANKCLAFKPTHFAAVHGCIKKVLQGHVHGTPIYEQLFPRIVEHACQWPYLFACSAGGGGLALLKPFENSSVTLTAMQVSCLVCLAFLDAFPAQSFTFPNSDGRERIIHRTNYFTLAGISGSSTPCNLAKMACFLTYLEAAVPQMNGQPREAFLATHAITFTRKYISPSRMSMDVWSSVPTRLVPVVAHATEPMEAIGIPQGMAVVDFANEYIGGGTLSRGAVQEEIIFLTFPECVVSMLICPVMSPTESILIENCVQYSEHSGYGTHSFAYARAVPLEELGSPSRCIRKLVAIDAMYVADYPHAQYSISAVQRELFKAYVGFSMSTDGLLVTGRWGCGVFGGDDQLKFVIQWIAASLNHCAEMHYCAFGGEHHRAVASFVAVVNGMLSSKELLANDLLSVLLDVIQDWDSQQDGGGRGRGSASQESVFASIMELLAQRQRLS